FHVTGVQTCALPISEMAWQVNFNNIGSFSSTRVADLNRDGILDIVMGAGGKENSASDTAIIALDGATGQLLWKAPGENQFVGSSVHQHPTADGIREVVIGGRRSGRVALSRAGRLVIWRFLAHR